MRYDESLWVILSLTIKRLFMSSFVKNAEKIAQQTMTDMNSDLVEKFVFVIRFLCEYPTAASGTRGKNAPTIGSAEYIQATAQTFFKARQQRPPQKPSTIPDDVVGEILHYYFDVPKNRLATIKREHQLSMAAENMVGNILEHYLASVLEKHGWVWCAGSMIKAVDFIKPLSGKRKWRMLQVKNRDNSENSSSSAIRSGTTIEKWFRTFSRKQGSNWENFPDQELRIHLSEEKFRLFVVKHLKNLRG
jgi:hypothetical protein